MTTLSAWMFDDATAATAAAHRLDATGDGGVIERLIVRWPTDAPRPIVAPPLRGTGTPATGWKAFWGNLFGMTLAAPAGGMAAGLAYMGFTDMALSAGLDDDVAEAIEEHMEPGTSALLVIAETGVDALTAVVGSAPRTSAPVPDDFVLTDALQAS